MTNSTNFDASGPGLDNDDVDPDEALALAFEWLRRACEPSGSGVLVMNASQMRRNRPLLGFAPWDIVPPRTHRPHREALSWPSGHSARALELAESLAFGTALWAIAGTLFDIARWDTPDRRGMPGSAFNVEAGEPLPAEVRELLDHMLVGWPQRLLRGRR
ncbi:MAG: hypothetical protein H0X16_06835 [Chloroflexi bacterium]|nr:hypothetical protein [Chloroflexota bacterium]